VDSEALIASITRIKGGTGHKGRANLDKGLAIMHWHSNTDDTQFDSEINWHRAKLMPWTPKSALIVFPLQNSLGFGFGCSSHPTRRTQELMTRHLVTFLKDNLEW
jgi:hypothetical protein